MKRFLFAITLLSGFFVGAGHAQEKPPANELPASTNKPQSPLRQLLDESLTWYQLVPNEGFKATMEPRVVMRWANNTRGSDEGMTVLFLSQGRPEAVCCVYPWESQLNHEFDSLSRGTFVGKRNGVAIWKPSSAGLNFKAIPDAEAPAQQPAARLRQLKTLASQFSSTLLGWKSNNSDRESLRLLPQPLYRYESKRSDVLDGAIFAFVQGTDPESLLLIEAFQKGSGFEWQYAFVRRTSGELEGRFREQLVWHVDRYPEQRNATATHYTFSKVLPTELLDKLK